MHLTSLQAAPITDYLFCELYGQLFCLVELFYGLEIVGNSVWDSMREMQEEGALDDLPWKDHEKAHRQSYL